VTPYEYRKIGNNRNWAGIAGPWPRKQSPLNPSIKRRCSCPHLHSLPRPHQHAAAFPFPCSRRRLLLPLQPPPPTPTPAATGSRATATRSVLPQAVAVFTDELPPDLMPLKPDPEPPPPFSLRVFVAATIALRRISRQGNTLPLLGALPLRRRLKN
jgi:hypothetical protein